MYGLTVKNSLTLFVFLGGEGFVEIKYLFVHIFNYIHVQKTKCISSGIYLIFMLQFSDEDDIGIGVYLYQY